MRDSHHQLHLRSLILGCWLVGGCLAGCGDSDGGNERTPGAGAPSSGGSVSASGGSSSGGRDASTGGAPVAGAASGGRASTGGSGGEQATLLPPFAIASTSSGTCALDAQGLIHCWGLAPETWAIPAGNFVELHSSSRSVCGVRADRSIACFAQPLGIQDLTYLPSGPVQSLAMGAGAVCTLSAQGEPACAWEQAVFAIPPPAGEHFKAIAIGYQFACGITDPDQTLLCWGSPGTAECLWGPAAGQLDAPEGTFIQVSSGEFSSCALKTDGSVACWGAGEPEDDPAELCREGRFNFAQSSPPSGVFRTVSAGANNGCGIRADGTIACWGAGTTDECVARGVDCRQSRPPAGVFEQVALGMFHTCAMRSDRTVECWGWDGAGDGRTTPPAEFR